MIALQRHVPATILLLGGLAAVVPASGQTIAITGGRVHTISGPVLASATVLIEDGRITGVGTDVTVPAGAQVIDASGLVVTPGFMDPMTGIGLTEIGAAAGTSDGTSTDDHITAAFRVADAINPMSTLIPVTRVEGITTVGVAPSASASIIAGQSLVMDLGTGSVIDRLRRDPVGMVVMLGEQGSGLAGGSRANAVLRLREAIHATRDCAENREAYAEGRRWSYGLSRLDLEALVPVTRGELPLIVQANRVSDIQVALRLSRELDVRMVLSGVAEGWLVAEEIAAAGLPVIMDPLRNLPTFDGLGATLENAGKMSAAGVEVAFSSFDAYNVRNIKQSAGNAVSYGMPHDAALRAVTSVPASILGVDDVQGTLEPGRIADVVVWSGDPFELSTQVRHVVIRGELIDLESRQRELFRRYRDLTRVPPRH